MIWKSITARWNRLIFVFTAASLAVLPCGTFSTTFLGLPNGRRRDIWSHRAHETSNRYWYGNCRAARRPCCCVSVSADGIFLLPAVPNLSHYALALSGLR